MGWAPITMFVLAGVVALFGGLALVGEWQSQKNKRG